jgi:hypothetical protein
MRDDATQGIADVGEFASAPVEDAATPTMISKVRKSVDVDSRSFISLHRKEHIDAKASN